MASTVTRSLARRSLVAGQWARSTSSRSRFQSTNSTAISPESPRFIDIPRPLQQTSIDPPYMKGILPRPRRIFKDNGEEKDSAEYFDRVNPSRTTERPIPSAQHKEVADYKIRISALRRQHLKDGIHQLRQRKIKIDNLKKAHSLQKSRKFQQAVAKPRRQEDILTQVSVQDIEKEDGAVYMSAEEIAERKERLAELEAAKTEERRANLHTLYMNARDFIVTEEQLDKKVDEVFDAPFYQNENDASIWREYGMPDRISDLLRPSEGRASRAVQGFEDYAQVTRGRLQRITEELTGGKMDGESRKISNGK